MDYMSNKLFVFICHCKGNWNIEFSDREIVLHNKLGRDNVELGTFIKECVECEVVMSKFSNLEGSCRECTCEVNSGMRSLRKVWRCAEGLVRPVGGWRMVTGL